MNIFHKVTLKSLKKNRTRTLVTIVGIILSAAMFTAVTTSISSLKSYMLEATIYNKGNWYGAAYGLSTQNITRLTDDSRIRQSVSMELLGFADLKDSINDAKPYLCVYGIESDFTEMMPIHLIEGRMPQNNGEILLPEHLQTNGGIDWDIDDELTLQLGTRVSDYGDTLTNQDSFLFKEEEESSTVGEIKYKMDTKDNPAAMDDSETAAERLIPAESRHYTVVGIYERPEYEAYHAPGYTALTIGENNPAHLYDIYLRTEPGKDAAITLQDMLDVIDDTAWELNYDLLRIYGYSGESTYNQVLYRLGIILIFIIMFGSISLIYNAFSISVSERTKQFGLLASIGATKRQLIGSVLFESLFLSLIGIPLGILSGLLGIGITFYVVHDMLANVFGSLFGRGYEMTRLSMIFGPAKEVSLELRPSLPAIAIAVSVSLLTVIISAWLPARRAMKKSAIDAIRQSNDIAIRPKRIKTSRLTQKLFGFEGMIATKNYKRNRRKYRATVISLFLSVVLFISASSFCAYLSLSTGTVLNKDHYDISYHFDPSDEISPDILLSDLSEAGNATASTYAIRLYLNGCAKTSDINSGLRDYWKKEAEQFEETYQEYDDTDLNISFVFLADDSFRDYLLQEHLDEDAFFDKDSPKAVATDSLRLYGMGNKYYSYHAFSGKIPSELSIYLTKQIDGYDYAEEDRDENGNPFFVFYPTESGDDITLPRDEACREVPISIEAVADRAPEFFADDTDSIQLFYPYSMLDYLFADLPKNENYYNISALPISENMSTELFFKCKNHKTSAADMTTKLVEKGLNVSPLTDYAAEVESERALINVINVFSYGFITLISLIAAANVFNTISTNINLRRREFAMLKSIGMTPKAFTKMMNFECILYGFKGLLYGLPASFLVTWMIYRSVNEGLEMSFFVPGYSVAIAVGSVFLVVFATMLYSMKKIKKENTIDTLKNENL